MSELRIAVLGVGVMGADHVARISSRISGARVAVVNDYLPEKAAEVAAAVPGARVADDPLDAIADRRRRRGGARHPGSDAREATARLPGAPQTGAV